MTTPTALSGKAGTGKTIVALHRAVRLARENPDARILLTTYSEPLAKSLGERLKRLASPTPRVVERIEIESIGKVGRRLFTSHFAAPPLATHNMVAEAIVRGADGVSEHRHTIRFLAAEWEQVVDPWQITTWETYRDVPRIGRKTRLPEPQRQSAWSVFDNVWHELHRQVVMTESTMFDRVSHRLRELPTSPFDFVIVDESQDFGVRHLHLLAALGKNRPDALFLVGDLGQRIFQQPFSWKKAGVDIRGRAHSLRVNYRSSRQIQTTSDRLLPNELHDLDDNVESRGGECSTFNGPEPTIGVFEDSTAEQDAVAAWLSTQLEAGMNPHDIAVIVRTEAQIDRARTAVERIVPCAVLDASVTPTTGHVSIVTMPAAKGLEFRAVAVMACDDEVIPLQSRVEQIGDGRPLGER